MVESGLIQKRDAGLRFPSPFRAPEEGELRKAGAAQPIEILLVEDNPADARFFREALHMAGIAHQLTIVTNGEEALQFLHRQGQFRNAPRPQIVVLDLKLPRVSGHAVLAVIRVDPELRSIPGPDGRRLVVQGLDFEAVADRADPHRVADARPQVRWPAENPAVQFDPHPITGSRRVRCMSSMADCMRVMIWS